MNLAANQAEAFFYEHAPFGYDARTETPEQGRVRRARALAAAEKWMGEQSAVFVNWEPDDVEPFDDEQPAHRLWCLTVEINGRGEQLSGIELSIESDPDTDRYARVFVAELAEQVQRTAQEATK